MSEPTPEKKEEKKSEAFIGANFLELKGGHCFKCHKNYPAKEVNHSILCKERVGANKDGGAVSCGKLTGGECEFSVPPVEICGKCKKAKSHKEEKERCHCGRPIEYSKRVLEKSREYLDECKAIYEIKYRPKVTDKGDVIDEPYVAFDPKIPTIEGLAVVLNVHRDTLYEWEKEYQEFSDIMTSLRHEQANRLINSGLSGAYNPTITKVLLTKHGYREGSEISGPDGKDLFSVDPDKKKKSDDAVKKFLKKP